MGLLKKRRLQIGAAFVMLVSALSLAAALMPGAAYEPAGPDMAGASEEPAGPDSPEYRNMNERLSDIGGQVPEFGGVHVAEEGVLEVYVTDPEAADKAEIRQVSVFMGIVQGGRGFVHVN